MVYLATGNWRSAVYRSQVIGTCEYLRHDLQVPIKLVTLTSVRLLIEASRSLSREYRDSTALPLHGTDPDSRVNRLVRWSYFRWRTPPAIIARGVRATHMALHLRDRGLAGKVCYDGRGAIAAEKAEYLGRFDPEEQRLAVELERRAVLQADFRLSVSARLVAYWRERYGYGEQRHAVVPCALKMRAEPNLSFEPGERAAVRASLDFEDGDVILVYAGSLKGWQSLKELTETLGNWLGERSDLKVLFLAREDMALAELQRAFPSQVRRRFVKPDEVDRLLSAADYGLLLREPSTTNAVAAPTKFAEYLAAGLEVLISPGIGDYSDFVVRHGCGHLVSTDDFPLARLKNRSDEEREASAELARRYFVRSSYRKDYERVVEALGWRLR